MVRRSFMTALAVAAVATAADARAADLKVLSTPTLKGVIADFTVAFQKETNNVLSVDFEGVPVLKRRIESGEAFDVALLLPAIVDDLAKQGKLAAGTRADIARTAAGIAVRTGATKLKVDTRDDLKAALLSAKGLSYSSDSASGTYFLGLLARLGIEAETKPRLIPVAGRSPVDLVASGEAEMTVITVPNIIGVTGVELGGLLPEELQNYTTFSAAIAAGTKQPTAAAQFIAFLRSPSAIAAIRKRGLDPIAP